MKTIKNYFLFVSTFIISILPAIAQEETTDQSKFPVLNGPYLGQITPRMKAEIFAQEILVSKGAHTNIVFSLEGKEAYWSQNGILFSKLENGKWITPQLLPFSKKEYSDDAPFLSPDGKRLFFTSKRPTTNSDLSRKENIWVVDLTDEGWSEARLLPPIVNNMFQHWQVSVDMNRNLYFGHRLDKDSDKDIYLSKYINGEFQKPEKLGEMINSELGEINPFISPNGDYLIFSRIKDGIIFDGGLFISFRLSNDTWSEAKPLKQYLKFRFGGNCAIVTQESKYLFFLDSFKGEWERYWVSAKFLKELKPLELKNK